MPNPTLKPLDPAAFDEWKAQHLLNRAGFGGTPQQVRALTEAGLAAAVDLIVNYDQAPAPDVLSDAFDRDIMQPATAEERAEVMQARRSGDEKTLEMYRMERERRQASDRRQIASMQRWWLTRIIETARPLQEKLTLFWSGHFATSYRGVEDSYHMFIQNQFFRANAAGNFCTLVRGIINDPAMLRYLNNDQNRKEQPNENLARELMELFTLGEGHGYSEDDIKNGARALTGYTFNDNDFVFRSPMHDGGTKMIFGQSGKFDGVDFCNLILAQEVCSEYICWKLYRFFVNDSPGKPDRDSQAFIVKLAKQLRQQNYELRPVLITLFSSEHFYDDQNVASVIKSPVQLIVQGIRSLNTPARNIGALLSACDLMGQNLFYPPTVKGWDGGRSWINTSTLFVRQNLVIYLLTGRRPDAYEWQADGREFNAMHLIEHAPQSTDSEEHLRMTVEYLLRFTLGTPPHPDRIRTLVNFVNDRGGEIDNDVLIEMLSLIAAMPEYQLC
jgi:uncharacterized protein (DUF1800 family)